MTRKALTDAQGDEAAKRYRKGESIRMLAEAFGVSTAPIFTALRARGVRIRTASGTRKMMAGLHGRIT